MIQASAHPVDDGDRILTSNADLFTFLGIGDVFRRAFEVLGARFPVFMTLTGIMLAPGALIALTFITIFGETIYEVETGNTEATDYLINHIPVFLGILLVQLLVSFVTFIAGEGAMIRAAADIYANNHTQTWKANLKAGLRCFCNVFLANLMVFGILVGLYLVFIIVVAISMLISQIWEGLGISLIIVGYIALLGAYFVVFAATLMIFPVIVIEGKGPLDAVKRSWELSKQHLCYVFCSLFLLGLAKLAITVILTLLFGNPSIASNFGFIVIFLLPTLVFLPIQAIMRFVMYASIRSLMEGYNEQSLKAELGNQGYTATIMVDDGEAAYIDGEDDGFGDRSRQKGDVSTREIA